jgi:hypothetical protein
MLKRKRLRFDLEGFKADLTISAATTGRGLERSGLVEIGLRTKEPNPLVKSFLWLQWPVIKAGTVEGQVSFHAEADDAGESWITVSIEDLGPFQFLNNVPEQVAAQWTSEILQLNPHWMIGAQDLGPEEEASKKKRSKTNKKS